MKKFLSMVLALVMVMSLVTVSAGAKEFTDDDSITYDEAVDVISTIGVVDGDTDGSFRPTDTLTRQAAAKIICNLILGPTTAAELHADTAPYKDVAVNNQFAGYIAYCQSRGIISGYADGTFRPTGTLTGYAFMKMLLGALGYDSSLEGYVGANWSINVAKQALGIKLNKGLEGEFNGIKAVTREEACLYAFRTIQADLVEYGQRLTTNVNGTEVTLSSGGATSRKWNSQQSRYDYIRDDNIIQFAEEYFNKLEKRKDRDDFERPAYTWIYDKEEIGTYVDWELLMERYTTGVSGRDLYDLLGSTALKDNDFVYYVNGVVPSDSHPMNIAAFQGKVVNKDSNIVVKDDIVRSNKDDVGITDNGVLTEVFLDKEDKVITITSIDTFLSKALSDYNESKEYAPLEVYTGLTGTKDAKKTTKTTWNVDVEDVAAIADVKEGDYKLVNITFKNDTKGEVVILSDPEIMDESTVTKFSKDDKNVASKVTVGGTEYKAARRAFFSDDALNWYDETLLTDKTYNVYMDPYGFFIGLELYEGAKNYVFITGFDRPTSNLSISTAKANGIFLDGTMQNITVNVKATNDNIKTANTKTSESFQYFTSWDNQNLPGKDGSYRYNRWFTYSVTADGVYTLKPCTRMTATKYTAEDTVIRTDNLYVDDNVYVDTKHPYNMDGGSVATPNGITPRNPTDDGKTLPVYKATRNERSYGEDETVFITVGLDETDTVVGARAITDVEGVYTGVQNVEIEIDNVTDMEEAQIYTVYDSDHYMIAAIVVGEAKGANAHIAYVVSAAKSERIEDGVYYWEFDAILDGTKQTLTAKSKYDMFDANNRATIDAESAGKKMVTGAVDNLHDGLVELRFDADDYVVDVKQIDEKDIYNFYGNRYPGTTTPALKGAASVTTGSVAPTGTRTSVPANEQLDLRDAKAYRMNVIRADANNKGWVDGKGTPHYYDSVPSELFLQGRTLYVTTGQYDEGLALASDCKAIVIQKENNKNDVLTEWPNVETALSHIADHDPDTTALEFVGEVIAVMNDRGAASWVVFKTADELHAGSGAGVGTGDEARGVKATNVGFNNRNGNASFTLEVKRPDHIPQSAAVRVDWTVTINGQYATSNIGTVIPANQNSVRVSGPGVGLDGIAYEGDRMEVSIDKVTFDKVKVLYVANAADTTNTVKLNTAGTNTGEIKVKDAAGQTLTYTVSSDYNLTTINGVTDAIGAGDIVLGNLEQTTGAPVVTGVNTSTGEGSITLLTATADTDYARVIIPVPANSQRDWTFTGFSATALNAGTWATGSSAFAALDNVTLTVSPSVANAPEGTPVKYTVTVASTTFAKAGAVRVQIDKLDIDQIFTAKTADGKADAVAAALTSVSKTFKAAKDVAIATTDVKVTALSAEPTYAEADISWTDYAVTIKLSNPAVALDDGTDPYCDTQTLTGGAVFDKAELTDGGKTIVLSFTDAALAAGDGITVAPGKLLAAYGIACTDTNTIITLVAGGTATLA